MRKEATICIAVGGKEEDVEHRMLSAHSNLKESKTAASSPQRRCVFVRDVEKVGTRKGRDAS